MVARKSKLREPVRPHSLYIVTYMTEAHRTMISFFHLSALKKVLEDESCNLIDCFFKNFMKANPSKFQAICMGKNAHDGITSFNIGSTEIKCDNNVTLLGINIDFMLRFDDHVAEICKKSFKTTCCSEAPWPLFNQTREDDHL